ncbi:fumarylacetoacetate hydrolase family protein [Actinomadura opuntiae]|uniref:fumarylacetoacetate hydrolase family protein n=1 Tax=Actinomadura sp. OS1-43 TaxID=604315 RepID=UPI00255AEF29|nr:fumarylacetoacetate hydrolase family protein [Actinomadura sp. OS1-43]MDL4812679.1 fumarylacetoacetate hydrolase family protein [Actinomadura sp. OS1-43]
MRWVTYRSADGADHPGLLDGDRVLGLRDPGSVFDLLTGEGLAAAAERARRDPREVVPADSVRLRAPVPAPPSVRDFMSFEAHVVNSANSEGPDPLWYEQPTFYFTNPAAITGPDEEIEISPGSTAFDYELEICAVVGRAGSNLSPEQAEEHIAGYMLFCDWSARDLQGEEMKLGLGPAKGKDGVTSTGPALVTPDELAEFRSGRGYDLAMTASVNGERHGGGSWADIHWSFPQMLAYASRGTTLRPGDLIASGTVGTGCILELSRLHGADRYPWLEPGDVVTLQIEQLGAITGRITSGPAPIPL